MFSRGRGLLRTPLLGLNLHGEELGRLVGGLSLRADFSDPGVLGGWFLVEDVDLVVGHPLLRHNDLLTPINDKVSSLIKATIFTIFHSLMLIQTLQLTEF